MHYHENTISLFVGFKFWKLGYIDALHSFTSWTDQIGSPISMQDWESLLPFDKFASQLFGMKCVILELILE